MRSGNTFRALAVAVACMCTTPAFSQKPRVEHSIAGIQAGWGLWLYHEAGISDNIALRSEAGVHARIRGGNLYEKPKFVMSPVLTLEPRWYYNFNKRVNSGKRIDGNSADFISLKASWHPDWFGNSTADGINDLSDIALVPTWGMRRISGKSFAYEIGFGAGCRLVFAEYAGTRVNDLDGVINVNVRIGLTIR